MKEYSRKAIVSWMSDNYIFPLSSPVVSALNLDTYGRLTTYAYQKLVLLLLYCIVDAMLGFGV